MGPRPGCAWYETASQSRLRIASSSAPAPKLAWVPLTSSVSRPSLLTSGSPSPVGFLACVCRERRANQVAADPDAERAQAIGGAQREVEGAELPVGDRPALRTVGGQRKARVAREAAVAVPVDVAAEGDRERGAQRQRAEPGRRTRHRRAEHVEEVRAPRVRALGARRLGHVGGGGRVRERAVAQRQHAVEIKVRPLARIRSRPGCSRARSDWSRRRCRARRRIPPTRIRRPAPRPSRPATGAAARRRRAGASASPFTSSAARSGRRRRSRPPAPP